MISHCTLYALPLKTHAKEICKEIHSYCVNLHSYEPWFIFAEQIYENPPSTIAYTMLGLIMFHAIEQELLPPNFPTRTPVLLFSKILFSRCMSKEYCRLHYWLNHLCKSGNNPLLFKATQEFLFEMVGQHHFELDPMVLLIILAKLPEIPKKLADWSRIWSFNLGKVMAETNLQEKAMLFQLVPSILKLTDPVWSAHYIDHLCDSLLIQYANSPDHKDLIPLYQALFLSSVYKVETEALQISQGDEINQVKTIIAWIDKVYYAYWEKGDKTAGRLQRVMDILKQKFPKLRKKIAKIQARF